MIEILESIPTSTQFNVAALIVYLVIVKRVTAFSFVFVSVLMIDGIHFGLEYWLSSLHADPEFSKFVFFAWYLSFGITDFILVSLILLWSQKSKIPLDIVSKLVLTIYSVLGITQIAMLIERLTINSELMYIFYSNSIPLANILITVLLIGYTLKTTFQNFSLSFRAL